MATKKKQIEVVVKASTLEIGESIAAGPEYVETLDQVSADINGLVANMGSLRLDFVQKEQALLAAIQKLDNDRMALVKKTADKLGIDINSKDKAFAFDLSSKQFTRTK